MLLTSEFILQLGLSLNNLLNQILKQLMVEKQLDYRKSYTNQISQPTSNFSIPVSQLLTQYASFLQNGRNENNILSTKREFLKRNNIIYNPNQFRKQTSIIILNRSSNLSVMNLTVSFSHFMFEIIMFNIAQNSRTKKNLQLIGKGAFGEVYLFKILHQTDSFVVKSIQCPFRDSNHYLFQKTLKDSLFQYCLFKLFSVLEIGPYVKNVFGFDLIVYNDAIQFTMEVCDQMRSQNLCETQLKSSLMFMHSLNIIHGDIKHQNIMYSPKYQKSVFLDFGLSKYLRQKIGQKTLTYFFGSFDFCTEQMKNIFNEQKLGYVDLYYNDVYALQKVLKKEINMFKRRKTDRKFVKIEKQYRNFNKNLRLSFLIYIRDFEAIQTFVNSQRTLQILEYVTDLLKCLSPNYKLVKISKLLIQRYCFIAQTQKEIKDFHRGKILNPVINEKNVSLFQNRIKQITNHEQGTINDIMLFMLIFFDEDVTPIALYKKQKLMRLVENGDQNQAEYWENFFTLSMNPFLEFDQFVKICQIAALKLNIELNVNIQKQFKQFSTARLIVQIIDNKFGINFFQKYFDYTNNRTIKKSNLYLMKKYTPQFSNMEIEELIQQKTGETYYVIHVNPDFCFVISPTLGVIYSIQQTKKCEIVLPMYLSLFWWYEVIRREIKNFGLKRNIVQDINKYLQNFVNFKAAQRTIFITLMRKQMTHIKKYELLIQNYIRIFQFQYAKATSLCFCQFTTLAVELYRSMVYQDIMQLKNIQNTKKKLKQIIQQALKFKKFDKCIANIFSLLTQFCQICQMNFSEIQYNTNFNFLYEMLRQLIQSQLNFHIPEDSLIYLNQLVQKLPKQNVLSEQKQFIKTLYILLQELVMKSNRNTQKYIILGKIKTMKLLGEKQFQNSYQTIKQLVSQQTKIGCSIDVCLYQYFIQFSTILKQDCEKQVQLLLSNIFYDSETFRKSLNQTTIPITLSVYFAGKFNSCIKREQYFQLVFKYLVKTHQLQNQDLNFINYQTITYLIQTYFQINKPKINEFLTNLFNRMKTQFKKNPYLFCKNLSNGIFILEQIMTKLFYQKNVENSSTLFILSLSFMKFASYWINYAGFYFQRSFKLKMKLWMKSLIEINGVGCLKNRRKRIQINAYRNNQYKVCIKLQDLFQFHTNDRKKRKVYEIVENKITNNFYKIRKVKQMRVNVRQVSNLNILSIEIYDKIINSQIHQAKCFF